MIGYLTGVFIYFIIITACSILLAPMIRRYSTGEQSSSEKSKVPKVVTRFLLACIPFLRFWLLVGLVLLAFAPDSFVEKVKEQQNKIKKGNDE